MRTEREFTIRPLLVSDLGAVAKIHCDAFASSGLSCFGEDVVRRYYEWQMRCLPKLVGYVAAEGPDVCGYAFCGDTFLSPVPFLAKRPELVAAAFLARPSIIFDARICRMAAYAARTLIKKISPGKTPSRPADKNSVGSFWLEAVAVERSAQGYGIGGSLTRQCAECGFSQGFRDVYLAVELMNHRAIAVYESLGWRRVLTNGQWRGRMKLTAHSGSALGTAC